MVTKREFYKLKEQIMDLLDEFEKKLDSEDEVDDSKKSISLVKSFDSKPPVKTTIGEDEQINAVLLAKNIAQSLVNVGITQKLRRGNTTVLAWYLAKTLFSVMRTKRRMLSSTSEDIEACLKELSSFEAEDRVLRKVDSQTVIKAALETLQIDIRNSKLTPEQCANNSDKLCKLVLSELQEY